jgi:hypothetical protein
MSTLAVVSPALAVAGYALAWLVATWVPSVLLRLLLRIGGAIWLLARWWPDWLYKGTVVAVVLALLLELVRWWHQPVSERRPFRRRSNAFGNSGFSLISLPSIDSD